jgi:hypothetical protein
MLTRIGAVCGLLLPMCGVAAAAPAGPTYVGQVQLASDTTFAGTVVGGLSGISYDAGSGLYYVISDDRSSKDPARFYTARIPLSDNTISQVEFIATHPWLDTNGQPFGPLDVAARPPVVPPDPEAIAFDARRQVLYWSSEGERITDNQNGPVLLDPWVRIATLEGSYVGEFALPPMLRMSAGPTGPRRNNGHEGLTLSPSGRYLWAGMEGPGYEDGEAATEGVGALTRITRFDVETRVATAQYAYPIDPVTAGPGGDNGLSDLLALDDENFLALERGFGTHVAVRLYRVSIGDAEDVLARPSLTGAPVRTMQKTLLVDLTSTVDPLDNVEGITLGPTLPDGRQSLVMVSDDNFSPRQITQFLAFAL